MKSSDVRQGFLDYFAERGHAALPSGPLVPAGDATLLFTNAGMVQFKDHFLGRVTVDPPRAVTSQKCMRVSGKHNDLENVGPSPRHHTFFEMLGNFSFGDYFKAEAIEFAWELVTKVWGLPPERLFATVFEEDDEAEELWKKVSGLDPRRIYRCGAKDNFWAMGDTGPCGPCSEIFVDLQPDRPQIDFHEGSENGRYLEIWNLVFMQFDRGEDGETVPLPNPSIDTGAGLERVAAVLQGVGSNYDSDLFQPILAAAAALADRTYGEDASADVSMRVIADHLRAVTFLLADGVIPSNEGRGYVLRRILRRAVRHGMNLGFEEPFLHRLVPVVGEVLGEHYEELGATRSASQKTVEAEEQKFLSTVATASGRVQKAIEEAKAAGRSELDGASVFRFYDTFGLPAEVIREIAEEERFGVDEKGFQVELEKQRSRSRDAAGGSGKIEEADFGYTGTPPETRFVGYGKGARREQQAGIRALAGRGPAGDWQFTDRLDTGMEGLVVLDPTPFYAEAGGQVGDRGFLTWKGGRAVVVDTRKVNSGKVHAQRVRVEEGSLVGPWIEDGVTRLIRAEVDLDHRVPTERNHTGTHLLHAALRHVLGDGVRQAGSLVAPDRLRFDFTYGQPVTDDELREIESIVNRWVLESRTVEIEEGRDFEEARAAGAMALFGEKYGDTVRTVEVPGGVGSLELCGGCHVSNTGEIGPFLIVAERGVASGVRRIEALTGEGALEEIDRRRRLLARLGEVAGVPEDRLVDEIEQRSLRARDLERELSSLRMKMVSGAGGDEDDGVDVDGLRVVAKEVPMAPANDLRSMADVLRNRIGSGVVVLGARADGKVQLIVAVSPDATDRVRAGDVVKELAARVGGGGGGRPDFAQAGGRDPEALDEALAAAADVVREKLA